MRERSVHDGVANLQQTEAVQGDLRHQQQEAVVDTDLEG